MSKTKYGRVDRVSFDDLDALQKLFGSKKKAQEYIIKQSIHKLIEGIPTTKLKKMFNVSIINPLIHKSQPPIKHDHRSFLYDIGHIDIEINIKV